jgi:hypothetical protein
VVDDQREDLKDKNQGDAVTEAGSYLRPTDSRITQLKAQGSSRTCNGSKEEEAERKELIAANMHDAYSVGASIQPGVFQDD